MPRFMNQSLQARDQRFLIDVFVARLLVLFLVVLAPLPAWASEKKGIGLYELSAGDRISALKVAWYYTWRPDAIHGVASQKFVPMLWGGKHYDKEFKELKNQGQRPILLCINEPNKHDQSDMTIEEARLRLVQTDLGFNNSWNRRKPKACVSISWQSMFMVRRMWRLS